MTWQQGLEYSARTDMGMRRRNNQDSHVVALANDEGGWRLRGHVFMVADGMGAHAAGELASKLAVDHVPHLFRKHRDIAAPEALEKAVHEANAEVHRRGQANLDFHNMGTTASTLALMPEGALIAHLGDSRVYRLRGDLLEQLTFDHSLVWELRAAGQLSGDAELAKRVPKNVITRSLGPNATVQVDVEGPFPLEVGDTFLLCSDGLTGPVADEELAPIVKNLPPDEATQVLIDLANLRGGPDNITVLIAKITGAPLAIGNAEEQANNKSNDNPTHLAIWVVAGVCLIAALVMGAMDYFAPAAIAAAGAIVTMIGAMMTRGRNGKGSVASAQRFGRGPYTQTNCAQLGEFLKKLTGIAEELKKVVRENDWQVDWNQFNVLLGEATVAQNERRESDALRAFARAISHMMKEIRNRKPPPKKPSDSDVDL